MKYDYKAYLLQFPPRLKRLYSRAAHAQTAYASLSTKTHRPPVQSSCERSYAVRLTSTRSNPAGQSCRNTGRKPTHKVGRMIPKTQ